MWLAVLGTVTLLLVWLAVTYNNLVRLRNLVGEAWSGIDVQLKRRYNLIPSLVETVKGYSRHEQELFADISRIRSQIDQAQGVRETGRAENRLSGCLKSLFALVEAYPELKADKNFLALQDQLIEIEEYLQMARRYYNGTVRNLNIRVESFPANLAARLFGIKTRDYFALELATQREAPEVALEYGAGPEKPPSVAVPRQQLAPPGPCGRNVFCFNLPVPLCFGVRFIGGRRWCRQWRRWRRRRRLVIRPSGRLRIIV